MTTSKGHEAHPQEFGRPQEYGAAKQDSKTAAGSIVFCNQIVL
jgi:hypothetical protein